MLQTQACPRERIKFAHLTRGSNFSAFFKTFSFKFVLWKICNSQLVYFIPRDAPVGHRRGNNPVEYVFVIFIFLPRSRKKQCRILIEV